MMNKEKVGVRTPEYVSLQFQLAGLGSRAAAFLIDQLILGVANIVIIILFVFIIVGEQKWFDFLNFESYFFAIAIIIIFLLHWGYYIIFEFFYSGRTIGKKIMDIRVIQDNGHSITLLSSIIRNLLRIIDSLPIAYLLGIIMIFLHGKHKRIGDLVAGTIVVHERKKKRKKKLTPIEKEIHKREIFKENFSINEWVLKSTGKKDWELIKTYSNRFLDLQEAERNEMTKQVAAILYPKVGWEIGWKTYQELENGLLALYLHLKDEWEYEL